MSEEHIPAWKRIIVTKTQNLENVDFLTEDPLNVTTHLASGSLSKKEKKLIINNSDAGLKKTKKKVNKSTRRKEKREKLSKEDNQKKRNKVLKDQLRYLIEFYKTKVDKQLPKNLYQLESVSLNYSKEQDEPEDINGVVEVWKFSKQKQNWLLKNLFNVDEIPIQYDNLLLSYFKDIQGRSRKDLLEKCSTNINEWNAYATEQEEKIKAIIDGSTEDDKSESNDVNKDEDKDEDKDENGDENNEKKVEEKKVEIQMPNKEKVQRSFFLVQNIIKRDDGSEFANLQLKNFD